MKGTVCEIVRLGQPGAGVRISHPPPFFIPKNLKKRNPDLADICYNELMVKKVGSVSWEAEEYIVRDHDALWYLGLIVINAGLIALAVWQGWWTFIALVIACDLVILTSNLRPPRKIKYSLDNEGLTEGERLRKYEDFRAFGILKEGSNYSAVLIPKKRFGTRTRVYFPETNGEAIVDMLGARLPMEEIKLDFIDKLVNFLRI